MKFDLQNKDGLTLKTKGKYVREDIAVGLSESDKSALVPENMVEEASVLGVQGSLKKYDGTFEGKGTVESGSSATIKVTGWEGTTVPNTALIETVYFNTNMSVEDTVNILSQLTYGSDGYQLFNSPAKSEGGYPLYIGVSCLPKELVMSELGIATDIDWYVITASDDASDDNFIFMSFDPTLLGMPDTFKQGWNFESLVFNATGSDSSIGLQNDLLSSIISTTPFVQTSETVATLSGEYDGSRVVINELPNGEWKGTTVPDNGMVEKIYVNTNLSADEVVAICETLNFVPYQDFKIWVCFTDETMANGVSIIHFEIEEGEDAGSWFAIKETINGEVINIFTNFLTNGVIDGWSEYFTGEIELNIENKLSVVAPSLNFTSENEKASQLFSITPFTKTEANVIDLKPYIENKQVPLNIKLNIDTANSDAPFISGIRLSPRLAGVNSSDTYTFEGIYAEDVKHEELTAAVKLVTTEVLWYTATNQRTATQTVTNYDISKKLQFSNEGWVQENEEATTGILLRYGELYVDKDLLKIIPTVSLSFMGQITAKFKLETTSSITQGASVVSYYISNNAYYESCTPQALRIKSLQLNNGDVFETTLYTNE